MSAYDKLGLAMIPSGYKGEADENNAGGFLGKVYSVLPAQTTSDNLVTNGGFDTDSDWSKGTGWTIANGVATSTGTAGFAYLGQNISNTGHKKGNGVLTLTISDCTNFSQAGITIQETEGGTTLARSFNVLKNEGDTLANGEITLSEFVNYRDSLQFYNNTGSPLSIDNISYKVITDGDFDFSRGSDATRVNSQGYIESVQVLSDELVQNGDFEETGSELVTNGGFDTNSDWVTTASVTIENGQANFNSTPAYEFALRQTVSSVVINKIYKVSFDLTVESGNVAVYLKDPPSNSPSLTESGTYTYYFKATNNELRFRAIDLGFTGSIDNVSVKEVGQNWNFNEWTVHDDNGNLKAKFIGSTSGQYLQQQNVYTAGDKIRLKFTLSNFTSGSLRAISTGVVWNTPTILATNGTYTYDIDTTGVSNGHIYFQAVGGNFNGSIDNISVKEVTDDTDIPRLDYSDGCPSLLLEPQRSNLIEYSENIDATATVVNSTVTVNEATSPDGFDSANKYAASANFPNIRFNVSVSNTVKYTFSCFVKYDGYRYQYIRFNTGFDSAAPKVWFDLVNGVVATEQNGIDSSSIEDYGNGWYRIIATSTATSTDVNGEIRLHMTDTDNSETIVGSTSLFNYIWGAQLEQGSYPTSYIPTNGSTVTRLADVCNNAGDSTIFNDAEGVLYWEFEPITTSETYQLSISDGTGTNSVLITFSSNGSISYGNVEQTTGNDGLGYKRVAVRYNNGVCSLFVNGSLIETDTNTVISGLKSMQFGQANLGSSYHPKGETRSLLYFNEALSDAELEALTSSNIDQVLKNYQTIGERLGATYESTHVKTKLNELF